MSEKRTDKSSIIGMEIEIEERKKEEEALKRALYSQKEQIEKEREYFEQ